MKLVALSPQLAEHSRSMVQKKRLSFDILRDAGNSVATDYGLRWSFPDDLRALYQQFGVDLAATNGEPSWTLPLPARYLIDGGGIIRYARVNADYTRRPDPEETLEFLRGLRA